jgi:CRISPR system Cascade subunit CasB
LSIQSNDAATPLVSLIQRISDDLAEADPGTLAELRRLTPNEPGGTAFWRIVVTRLDRELPVGDRREEALRRWALILRTLAQLNGLHNAGHRFGTALAEAGISEARFTRLLRVSGNALFDQVSAVSRQLASAGVQIDIAGLARLVLSDGAPGEQAVRQGIANDYYQVIFSAEKEKRLS